VRASKKKKKKKSLDRTKSDSIVWRVGIEQSKTRPEPWNDGEAEPHDLFGGHLSVICFMAMYYV